MYLERPASHLFESSDVGADFGGVQFLRHGAHLFHDALHGALRVLQPAAQLVNLGLLCEPHRGQRSAGVGGQMEGVGAGAKNHRSQVTGHT